MKQAGIYLNDVFCGVLTEDEEGYHFCYEKNYLASQDAAPISPTMPLSEQQYDKEMRRSPCWTCANLPIDSLSTSTTVHINS